MIEWISTWAEQIIVAVIIASIIEMILPNGNSKKYIKAIIGVYILFTIVSPVIEKFTNINLNNIDYEKYFKEIETQEMMAQDLTTNNEQTMEKIYISNLKSDMKNKIEEKGYIVENIVLKLELDNENNYGKVNEIILTVYKNNENDAKKEKNTINTVSVNKIEEVKIDNKVKSIEKDDSKKEISNSDKDEIKDYLVNVYNVKRKNIKINEN